MSTIEFNVPIPAPPEEIHAYNTTPTAAPVEFINQKLTAANLPAMKLEATIHAARTAGAAGAPDEVHAVVNQTTGEAHLVPSLAKLVTAGMPLSQHNRQLPAAHAAGQAALEDEGSSQRMPPRCRRPTGSSCWALRRAARPTRSRRSC